MGNVSRLDQLRPLQFHMRCYTGDVLANTQDLYNRFLKATCIQVRSTAALPQWPTKKRVPAILLPPLSVVDTQACLVCLFYIAVPYSPRFIYCSVSFTLFSLAWKKNMFSRKTKFLCDNHAKEQDWATTTTKEKRSTNTNSHPAWTDMWTRNERKSDSKGHRPNYMQRKICREKELVPAHNVGHGWNTGIRKWWLSGKRLCMKWWNCSKSDAGVAEQFCEHTKSVELYMLNDSTV